MTRSSVPRVPLFTPGYLVSEIEDLRRLAQDAGLGTLDYLLELALIEARHQAQTEAEALSDVPDAERWKPLSS